MTKQEKLTERVKTFLGLDLHRGDARCGVVFAGVERCHHGGILTKTDYMTLKEWDIFLYGVAFGRENPKAADTTPA